VVYLSFVSLYFSQVGSISFNARSMALFAVSSISFMNVLLSEMAFSDAYLLAAFVVCAIMALPSSDFANMMAFSRAMFMLLDVAFAQARKKSLSDIPFSEHGRLVAVVVLSSFAMFLLPLHDTIMLAVTRISTISQNNFMMQIYKICHSSNLQILKSSNLRISTFIC